MIPKLLKRSVVGCTFLLVLDAVQQQGLLGEFWRQIYGLEIEAQACATLTAAVKVICWTIFCSIQATEMVLNYGGIHQISITNFCGTKYFPVSSSSAQCQKLVQCTMLCGL